MRLALCGLLAGCYFEARAGGSGQIGDRSGAGGDLSIGGGWESRGQGVRVGVGGLIGARLASRNAYIPVGVEGELLVPLAEDVLRGQFRAVFVGHLWGVLAGPLDLEGATTTSSTNDVALGAFAGVGLGSPRGELDKPSDHMCIGLTAARLFSSDGAWFIGGALEFTFGWDANR